MYISERKEGTGSGSHENRGAVTRKIWFAGAETCLSQEEGEGEPLVRETQERELKSNGAKFKVMRTGQRTVLVTHTETEAPDV